MKETAVRRNTKPLMPRVDVLNRVLSVPYEQYAEADAINAHGLMDLLDSPAAYQYRLANPTPPSDDMVIGTLVDMALLEPERFAATVLHGDRRKVKAEDGQVVVTEAAYQKVLGMVAGVRANSVARQLLDNQLHAQPTVFWHDAVHKVDCKARLDLITKVGSKAVAVDLKTTRDATPYMFGRSAANFHYDLQMAHYLEAGRATGLYSSDLYFFIVVGKTAPYPCFVYQAGDTLHARGTVNRDHAMQLYARCKEQNLWPGPAEFGLVELPTWAKPIEEVGAAPEEPHGEVPDLDLDNL